MENFPERFSVAVFVTALMPGPSLNLSTLFQEVGKIASTPSLKKQESVLDSQYTSDDGPKNPARTYIFGPMYLARKVYQLSPTEKYGSVRRVFIVSEKDEVGKKDFQQWMIDKNPPDKVEKIRGSDHMVMISDKPLELCFLLSRNIAGKYSRSQFTIKGKRIFCVKITWLNVTVK
ncbi:hypothetical protein RHGRI_007485 [Rhododendron griersonianum]|uniref:Uncharacterized protein n=1 Tax=Rhododendron griersonianum TaxID=479676 RepID=A0AAV6KYP4_9ERIC|nr:hypothetical protein RHGRI_007485 [Rhododendron griersonianum]